MSSETSTGSRSCHPPLHIKKKEDKHAYQPEYREIRNAPFFPSVITNSHYFEEKKKKTISEITVTQKDEVVLLISLDIDMVALGNWKFNWKITGKLLLSCIIKDFRAKAKNHSASTLSNVKNMFRGIKDIS